MFPEKLGKRKVTFFLSGWIFLPDAFKNATQKDDERMADWKEASPETWNKGLDPCPLECVKIHMEEEDSFL